MRSAILPVLAGLLLLAAGTTRAQILTASFEVRHGNCCKSVPISYSVRYKSHQSSGFSPWYLSLYAETADYYGRQNVSLGLSNISQIQYRIELPGKIGENCCLTVETYVDFYLDENLINASSNFCDKVSTQNNFTCGTDEAQIIPTQILSFDKTTLDLELKNCTTIDSNTNLTSASVISADVCPVNVLQCSSHQAESESITLHLSFLLTIRYPCKCHCYCPALDYINEGILVLMNTGTTTLPLHFYTDSKLPAVTEDKYLNITNCTSNTSNLSYDDKIYKNFPCTITNKNGPQLYSFVLAVNNTESVSFIWQQSFYEDAPTCDTWALDNVTIAIKHEGQSRIIYHESFDDSHGNWNITHGKWSEDSIECANSNGRCLYFSEGMRKNRRQAESRFIHVSLVEAVTLRNAQSSMIMIPCDTSDEALVHISFVLQVQNFTQPIPVTDSRPNTILLSLSTDHYSDKPVAYYAPVGNKYWSGFNGTTLYGVPIYSPNSTYKTELSFCVPENIPVFSLMWRQDNYTSGSDSWSFSQLSISSLKQQFIANESSWKYDNGNMTDDPCSSSNNDSVFLMDRGNGSNSRFVSVTFEWFTIQPSASSSSSVIAVSSDNPSATVSPASFCIKNGSWPKTQANTNIMGTCQLGLTDATRFCDENGQWSEVNCNISENFQEVLEQIETNPSAALSTLHNSTDSFTPGEVMLLLDMTVTAFDNVTEEKAQLATDIALTALSASKSLNNKERQRGIATQLLLTLDEVALKLGSNASINSSQNIKIKSQEIIKADTVVGISVDGNSITLPAEIFVNVPVRIASFIYQDLSSLLVPLNSLQMLVSPVVSATINCDGCKISGLMEQVNITFNFSSSQQVGRLSCVYWDIEDSDEDLPTGHWNESGCKLISDQDDSIMKCSCDHLTHFAILLSPESPIDDTQLKFLTIIGQVLVTVSLICMVLTILAYSCMRKLWSLRNYIHIMLCANLFIAQLTFLFGVQRTENEVACSVIAAVLQYMFLVTFMWMLMEGIILYIALVRVFTKHTKRYAFGFTIASYGIPAVYMMIVAPVGYLVDTGNDQSSHYLYYINEKLTACWLNYQTGFIWTFIAPVILIILANIGFFIMAIVIMKRHRKSQPKHNHYNEIRYWLRSSISLTVVMGISWLGNVLFFREELLFIAYIMTILIAGQGLIIFILYVPLSKNVRGAYMKWWNDKKANSDLLSGLSSKASNFMKQSASSHNSHQARVSVTVDTNKEDRTLKVALKAELEKTKNESFVIANNNDDDDDDSFPGTDL